MQLLTVQCSGIAGISSNVQPIRVLRVVMRAGSDYCKFSLKTTKEDTEEATANIAAKEISVAAAVWSV